MKKADILRRANRYIAEELRNGWLIDWGNASFGYLWCVNMIHKNHALLPRRWYITNGYSTQGNEHWLGQDALILRSVRLSASNGFENKNAIPMIEEVFVKIADGWYREENEPELKFELDKHRERASRRFKNCARVAAKVAPTKAFLKVARTHSGFTKVKLTDLRITREGVYYCVHNDANERMYCITIPEKERRAEERRNKCITRK